MAIFICENTKIQINTLLNWQGHYKQTNNWREVDMVAPQRAFRPLRSHGTERQHMIFAKVKTQQTSAKSCVGGGVVVG